MEETMNEKSIAPIKEEISDISFPHISPEEITIVEVSDLPYHEIGSETMSHIYSSVSSINKENEEDWAKTEQPTFYEMSNLPYYPIPSQSATIPESICDNNSLPGSLLSAESGPEPSFSAKSRAGSLFSKENDLESSFSAKRGATLSFGVEIEPKPSFSEEIGPNPSFSAKRGTRSTFNAESDPGPSFSAEGVTGRLLGAENKAGPPFSVKSRDEKTDFVKITSWLPSPISYNIKNMDHVQSEASNELDFDSIFVEVNEEEELYSEDEYEDGNYIDNLCEQPFSQSSVLAGTGQERLEQLDRIELRQAGLNDLNLLLANNVPYDYCKNHIFELRFERVNAFLRQKLRDFHKRGENKVARLDAHIEVIENILEKRRRKGVPKKPLTERRLGIPYFGNSKDFPMNEDWKVITALGHRMTFELRMDRNLSSLDYSVLYIEVKNYLRDSCIASTIPELEEIFDKCLKPNEEYLRMLQTKGVFDAIDKIGNYVDWVVISNITANSVSKSARFSPHKCRGVWELIVKPTINQHPWSESEDHRLLELAEEHNYENWDEIAYELDTFRNGFGCCVRYYRFLKKGEVAKFTKMEDERLMRAIEQFSLAGEPQWRSICYIFPNRTKMQLMCRYARLRERAAGAKKGKVKMGKFSDREKEVIDRLSGENMSHLEIAKHLPTRTSCQIREYMALKNAIILGGPWTIEEVDKLMRLVKEHGTNWKLIAELHGRNRQQCRIKYMRSKKTWSPEEIAKLNEGLQLYHKNWGKIADHVGTRNANECLYAFGHMKFCSRTKGPEWHPSQVESLLTLVAQYGTDWTVIAREMGDIKVSACSKKYSQIEKKCAAWSDEMTDNLLRAVDLYGENWVKVSEEVDKYDELECKIKYLFFRASQQPTKPKRRRRKRLDSAVSLDELSAANAVEERNGSTGNSVDSESFSKSQKKGSLISKTWEAKRLLKLVSESGGADWEMVVADLKGYIKHPDACYRRYMQLVNTYENILKGRNAELIEAVEKHGEDWSRVSEIMGATKLECEMKYLTIRAEEFRENHTMPAKKWIKLEIERLLNLVIEYGTSDWKLISSCLKGVRSPKACLEKYSRLVNDYENVLENKENELIEAVEKYGENWSQVSDVLGASLFDCKIKYLLIRANGATISHLKSNKVTELDASEDTIELDSSFVGNSVPKLTNTIANENSNELVTSSVVPKTQKTCNLNAPVKPSKLKSPVKKNVRIIRKRGLSGNKAKNHSGLPNKDLPLADSQTGELSSHLPIKRKLKNQIDEPAPKLLKKMNSKKQIDEPAPKLLKKRNSKKQINRTSPMLLKERTSEKLN